MMKRRKNSRAKPKVKHRVVIVNGMPRLREKKKDKSRGVLKKLFALGLITFETYSGINAISTINTINDDNLIYHVPSFSVQKPTIDPYRLIKSNGLKFDLSFELAENHSSDSLKSNDSLEKRINPNFKHSLNSFPNYKSNSNSNGLEIINLKIDGFEIQSKYLQHYGFAHNSLASLKPLPPKTLVDYYNLSLFKPVVEDYSAKDLEIMRKSINEYKEKILKLDQDRYINLEEILSIGATYYDEVKKYSQKFDVPLSVSLGILLLENSGRHNAVSSTGNAGIYQLSKIVGKEYGLRIDDLVDERFKPEKAIPVAIHYLKDMYDKHFGRWDLTMLAYHQGWPRVKKMISKYVAVKYHKHVYFGKIDPDTVKKYNVNLMELLSTPQVVKTYFDFNNPINGYGYVQKCLAFYELFNSSDLEKLKKTFFVYKVKDGDTLYEIAKKFNLTLSELLRINPYIREPNFIKPGYDILILQNKEL